MRKKRAIKRFFLTLMWLGVAIGMGTVITAAMRVQEAGVCKGYDIRIEGFREGMLFTSEPQILELLKIAAKGEIKGQRKTEFKLQVIEDLLEQSAWVYNADLYFDSNDILHANVTERKPLARIFTLAGKSFYIDEAGKQIPLSDRVSLDLPVFTGYPEKKVLNSADSLIIQNVITTASFINGDPFWSSQIAQIEINSCGTDCWNMEMVPVVGSHVVDLGDGSDIASKFHRLYLFYDQVLRRTGFDKYQKIDVQYNDQVIGVKEKLSKVDSIQLKKNIEQLLQQSRDYNEMVQVAPTLDQRMMVEQDSMADNTPVFSDENVFEDSLDVDAALTSVDHLDNRQQIAVPVTATAKPAVGKIHAAALNKQSGTAGVLAKKETKPVPTKVTAKKTEAKKSSGTATTAKKTEIIRKATPKKKVAPANTTKKVDQSRRSTVKKVEAKRNLLTNSGSTTKKSDSKKNTSAKKKSN